MSDAVSLITSLARFISSFDSIRSLDSIGQSLNTIADYCQNNQRTFDQELFRPTSTFQAQHTVEHEYEVSEDFSCSNEFSNFTNHFKSSDQASRHSRLLDDDEKKLDATIDKIVESI